MTKELKLAKKVDRFYERYLFYDWSNAQGEYTMQDLADDLSIHLTVWIDDLTDILETFDPGSTGYQECISIINDIKNLGGTTMKKVNDGWHKICGYDLYIENGYVIRGMAAAGIGYVGTHPYIKSRYGGWDNASGDLTIEAFRARVKRNSVIMA